MKQDAAHDQKTYLLTIRTGYFAVIALFAAIAVLCVGVTGIYFGSKQQADKDRETLLAARTELKDQQLAYEKRLGEQSARYAYESTLHVHTLEQLNSTIKNLKESSDRAASAAATAASTTKETQRTLENVTNKRSTK